MLMCPQAFRERKELRYDGSMLPAHTCPLFTAAARTGPFAAAIQVKIEMV